MTLDILKRHICFVLIATAALGVSNFAYADQIPSSLGSLKVEQEISGLNGAWGFGFLPSGEVILTEKRGRLFVVNEAGKKTRVRGLPDIVAEGQGGLLDVLVPKDFATTREIYFTFAKRLSEGTGTALAKARLDEANSTLEGVSVIFEMSPGNFGGRHFGSRVVEGSDGKLYVTIGDRGTRDEAQNLGSHNGTIVRINRDGSIPEDNPFAASDLPEIYSYGHRNPQGFDVAKDGTLWAVEHGAKGGDEVNLIERGNNYGWPVISYGVHYSGGKIGEGTEKSGMEQPAFYWDPSIAPSGLMIYEGEMFPEWQGDIFVGSLKFDYIARLEGSPLQEVERLSSRETKRVRDVREAPDGSIWFISEDRGSIYRLSR